MAQIKTLQEFAQPYSDSLAMQEKGKNIYGKGFDLRSMGANLQNTLDERNNNYDYILRGLIAKYPEQSKTSEGMSVIRQYAVKHANDVFEQQNKVPFTEFYKKYTTFDPKAFTTDIMMGRLRR